MSLLLALVWVGVFSAAALVVVVVLLHEAGSVGLWRTVRGSLAIWSIGPVLLILFVIGLYLDGPWWPVLRPYLECLAVAAVVWWRRALSRSQLFVFQQRYADLRLVVSRDDLATDDRPAEAGGKDGDDEGSSSSCFDVA